LGDHDVEDKESVEEEVGSSSDPLKNPTIAYEEIRHISMNVLSGINTYQSMKVMGAYMTHPLHILIDLGSTHNFLDVATVRRLRCTMRSTVPLQISVANGSKLIRSSMCQHF